MRSIAVISVLLFHLDKRLLPGGFVGVDVFFVISGYLITSIIYRECQSEKFSLSTFYQRRISRIFPVFFVVTLSILFAASALYTSWDFASAGALSAASALSIANLKLMLQGGYFELSPDSQPFLHYWSLSVEEQFYLFLPVTLVIAHKIRLSRERLLFLLWAFALASFAGCVLLTSFRPTWAFYLLPTRAWELLAGAILAIVSSRENENTSHSANGWLGVAGLSLILFSFFAVNEERPFPGYFALLPVIASILLIGRSCKPSQLTERILALPLLVFIGRLSYSLYLWHWPVYCFVDYGLYTESAISRAVTKIELTVVLSLASYACIEKPIRAYLNQPSKKRLSFIGFAVGVLAFSITGVYIRSSNHINASVANVANGGMEFKVSSASPSIVLMGDSHGSMYATMMRELAAAAGANINIISVEAWDPLPSTDLYGASMECLAKKKPAVTVFVAAWVQKIGKNRSRLRKALSEMLTHTAHIVLITQPPILPENASREAFRKNGVGDVFEDSGIAAERIATNSFLKSLENERIHVLDIEPLFVQSDGQIRFCDAFGRQLFQDDEHLSGQGASLVKELLALKVAELLASSSPRSSDKGEVPER